MSKYSIDDLPDLVLLQIFSIIGSERIFSLFPLRCVSRKWKALASDSSLWRRLVFPNKMFFKPVEVLELIASWCENIIEVNISRTYINKNVVDLIATKCPNIRFLKADQCQVDGECLKKLATNCVNLREVVVSPSKETSSDHFIDLIKNCPNLESLGIVIKYVKIKDGQDDLDYSEYAALRLSNEFIKSLLASNIKRFRCTFAGFLSKAFMADIDCQSTKLEELDLSISRTITDDMLSFIASKSPNLKKLIINGCSNITQGCIMSIVRCCPLLESIEGVLSPLTIDLMLDKCKHIQMINLQISASSVPAPNNSTLKLIADKCPTLKHINVSNCNQVTDEGIIAIANKCHQLVTLDVSFCRITDASLQVIAEKLINLKELIAYCCRRVTSVGVNIVAQRCIKLEVLKLHSILSLTDLNFVSKLCLRELTLNNTNVTDTCIENITKVCPHLKKFPVGGCGLTDLSLVSIGGNCAELEDLSIYGCSDNPAGFSSEALTTLAMKLTKLQRIDMSCCLNVNYHCVEMFVKHCPYMQEMCFTILSSYDADYFESNEANVLEGLEDEIKGIILKHCRECEVISYDAYPISDKMSVDFQVFM